MAVQIPAWFDWNAYLNNKLAQVGSGTMDSLVSAMDNAGFKGPEGYYMHFLQFGHKEDVSPSAGFDATQYYTFKAAQVYRGGDVSKVNSADISTVKQAIADAGMDAWTHYQKFGTAEMINASNSFDTAAYLQAKATAMGGTWTAATVATAIQNAGMNAYEHYKLYGGTGTGEVVSGATFTVDPNKQANVPGQTFTLTTAPDNIVGTSGDDTVNGYLNVTAASPSSTLTAADVINGGAGTDSLKLTVEGVGAGSLTNASISNVEKFFIRDVATGASAYDFSTINGETEVWADTATNAGGVVDFQNLGTGAVVGIKGNNVLTNLANVTFNMATAADAVSIAIDGGVKNTVPVTITNTTAGAATAATIASTGAANTVGAITLAAAAGNSVKTLTINAATDLTATLTAADFAADAKMVVAGAGKVNVGAGFDGATIDASANSGGLTVSTTTGVTKALTGSSAADVVTLVGSLTTTGKIDLGAGNDKLLAGAGAAIAGTNVIDGGAGSDSISASLINAANAAAVKNFELLDMTAATVTPLDVDLVTGSTITGLTLSGGAGAATVSNVAAGVGLTVDGVNTLMKTVELKGASTSAADSFAVTFDGAKVAGAAAVAPNVTIATGLHLDYVESVSVVSGGGDNTWNGLKLDGGANNSLQTLSISGAKNLDLTTTATAFGKVPTNAADTTHGLNLIDGSAATGKLVIDLTGATLNTSTSGLTVKGGSADDTITLVNSVLVAGSNSQKFVVDAGAGNDTINVAANGGTLTGGAGADTFNVALALATGVTAATSVLTTITDLAAGDKVGFNAGASGAFQSTKVVLGAGVTNLDQALAAAVSTATNVSWFQYAANTYVVADTDGSGAFSAGDNVVKVTGVVDLSASTLSAAVLTIA